MSHESNERKYSQWYHNGGRNALASNLLGDNDNLLRDRRQTLRRRVRKFLKDAAMKLGLL